MIRDGHEIFFSIRLNTDTHELIVYPINLYQKVFFVLANFFHSLTLTQMIILMMCQTFFFAFRFN